MLYIFNIDHTNETPQLILEAFLLVVPGWFQREITCSCLFVSIAQTAMGFEVTPGTFKDNLAIMESPENTPFS